LLVRPEEGLHLEPQRGVAEAGLVEIGRALPGGQFRRDIQNSNLGLGWISHGVSVDLSGNAKNRSQ
jgi:hypothetical protein